MSALQHTCKGLAIAVVGLTFTAASFAAPSSVTEAQLLYGSRYEEPGNASDVDKTILTLQHASSYKFGRNFFFVDYMASGGADNHATEVYGEWYSSLSMSKLTHRQWSSGLLKDVNLTAGINAGTKSSGASPRIFLPGVTLDLSVPSFTYLQLDLLAYIDRGRTDGASNGCHATTWQLTPNWKLPFDIGRERFSFEGFVDWIGEHGECDAQILAQPQLRWDLGAHAGSADKVFLGLELQHWHSKYGIDGLDETVPQALLVWVF